YPGNRTAVRRVSVHGRVYGAGPASGLPQRRQLARLGVPDAGRRAGLRGGTRSRRGHRRRLAALPGLRDRRGSLVCARPFLRRSAGRGPGRYFRLRLMLGDVRVQLRPGVQIVPRAQWPPAFGGHPAEWAAALSAPGMRTTSRLIDEPARRFLELLREPMAVTAAVLRTAEQHGGDPIEILEAAVPLLESLLSSQLLICVDDAPAVAPPAFAAAAPGTILHGWEVLATLHVVADTQVYLVTR